jgi:N-acetylmuramoyl-L-alanine amidase
MKLKILALIKRPSTWLSALAGGLLVLVVLAPGLEEREKEAGAAVVRVEEQGGAKPRKEAPVAVAVGPTPLPSKVVVAGPKVEPLVEAPKRIEPAPVPVPPVVAALPPVPKAIGVRPIEGPPPEEEQARLWEQRFAGPPDEEEQARQWAGRFVGPPALEELTLKIAASRAGPPSPAEEGPPAEWMMEAEKALLAKVEGQDEGADKGEPMRGEDSEFAHGEDDVKKDGKGAMVADGKTNLQKPTTRITPPAPVVAAEPEPAPPALSEEPLPPAQGAVWKVVKVDGRDYVTGQSMQLFYRFSTHKVDGKHVWFRNPNLIIKGQIGSQELLVNNIKFILSYPVLSQGGQALFSRLDLCKLIEPVIRPSYIGAGSMFDTVVLDAGHGGHDSGAKGVYGYEKNYALAMVMSVKEALMKRGFKVLMTRSNDTFLSLTSRVALANRTPNSIFISIHFNSGGSAASGIETFALTPQGSASSIARGGGFSNSARAGNQFDSENIALATAVHAQVVHRFKLIDRGIKRARWTVLTGCNRPGILFEGGFVTNSRECQLIASDSYRKAVAEAIGDAVTNYRRALAPKPAGR